MRPSRAASAAALAAVALGLASAGAAVNLRLLEPRAHGNAPLALDPTAAVPAPGRPEPGDTTTTAAPEITATVPPTSEPTTTTTTTVPTPPASTSTPVTASAPRTYSVGAGGSVTLSVRSGQIVVEAVGPAAGWSADIDKQSGDEVEVSFRSDEREASLHARIENGQLSVEIETSSEPPDD